MIRITHTFYSRLLAVLTALQWDRTKAQALRQYWEEHKENLYSPCPTEARLKAARKELGEKISLFTEMEKFVHGAIADLSTHALSNKPRATLLGKFLKLCEMERQSLSSLHVAGAYPLGGAKLTAETLDGPGYVVIFTTNQNTSIHAFERSLDTGKLTTAAAIEECRVFF